MQNTPIIFTWIHMALNGFILRQNDATIGQDNFQPLPTLFSAIFCGKMKEKSKTWKNHDFRSFI